MNEIAQTSDVVISTAEYLGMTPDGSDGGWTLPITGRAIGGGRGSLFGGVGLAAGVIALEQVVGKSAVWATGQYASTVFPPASMDLTVELPAVGRTVSQGRVIGRVDGREIIAVLGAAGRREEVRRGMWDEFPQARSPEDSLDVGRSFEYESIHSHVDVRIASGMFGFTGVGEPTGDNTSVLWVRMPGVHHDAAALAILADYSPSVLGSALGQVTSLTSLDNTIRFTEPLAHESEWILLQNRVDFVGNGFAQTSCRMWSQDGSLLATASQSATVVIPKD